MKGVLKLIKLTEFERKGMFFEVMLDLVNPNKRNLYLIHKGEKLFVHRIGNHNRLGPYYEVSKKEAERVLGFKIGGKGYLAYIGSDTALKVEEEADKLFKDFKEREIEKAFNQLDDDSEIILFHKTSHTFVTTHVDYANKHPFFIQSIKAIKSVMDDDQIRMVLGREADDVEWGDYSITYIFKMTFSEFKKLTERAQELVEEKEAKKEAREKAKQEAIKAKFAEAKETRKPVELSRWTTECCDPKEECSLDVVVKYAMPDGSARTERYHTY